MDISTRRPARARLAAEMVRDFKRHRLTLAPSNPTFADAVASVRANFD
jgi:hypothetical protein